MIQKLKSGDEVRIISPALSFSILSENTIKTAEKRLTDLGLKVTYGKYVRENDIMSSSSIKSRIEDLHAAFADKNVKAILTVLGGFNSNQLLDYINYDLIKANPKILCGYSDITALQNAIYAKTEMITFSGSHFATFGMPEGFEYTQEYFIKTFFENENIIIQPSKNWSDDEWWLGNKYEPIKNEGYWILNEGTTSGVIIGTNLSTLQLLYGTKYMPSIENSILFIEDDAYTAGFDIETFDRNLQSLIHQENFEKIKGIVIGRFQKKAKMTREKLEYIIKTKEKLENIPIIANADFGHTMPIITIPIGGKCNLSAKKDKVTIEILSF